MTDRYNDVYNRNENIWGIPETVETELRAARDACIKSKAHSSNYALAYINAVPAAIAEATAMGMSGQEGLRTQMLYILGNLGWWRGDRARQAKRNLKGWLNKTKVQLSLRNEVVKESGK